MLLDLSMASAKRYQVAILLNSLFPARPQSQVGRIASKAPPMWISRVQSVCATVAALAKRGLAVPTIFFHTSLVGSSGSWYQLKRRLVPPYKKRKKKKNKRKVGLPCTILSVHAVQPA